MNKIKTTRKSIKDYDVQIRKLAADGLHCRAIAKRLDLTPPSLSYFLKKNNIKVADGKSTVATDSVKLSEISRLHVEGFTYEEIANLLNINTKSVQKFVNELGLQKRTHHESYRNTYTIDESAFTKDDSETAYWLGWVITDGCLTDANSIYLSLKGEDGYIVEAFKQYLGSTAKCKYTEYFHKQCQKKVSQAAFSVRSSVIADNLKKHNVAPRKSCKEKPPAIDWLNGEHASIFWRACIEGDGYVSKDYEQPCISIVGSEELLSAFREYCEKICGVKIGKPLAIRKAHRPDYRTLEYTGIDSRKIMRNLWSQGDIFLKRKQDRVKAVIEHWKHEET